MSEFDFPLNDASDWLSLERIDHCCDRFEEALLKGDSPRIEDFLRETVRVHESLVLQELLRVELHHGRSQRTKPVSVDEYVARFPEHVELIRRTFEEHHLTQRGGTTHAPNADARRRRLGLRSPIDSELNWPTDGNGSQARGEIDLSRIPENESESENSDMLGVESPRRDRPESESRGDESSEHDLGAKAVSVAGDVSIGKKTKLASKPNRLGPDGRGLPATFGHFKLLREVGRGGMGVVYEAEQGGTKRRVALKLIRRDRLEGMSGASFKEALSRFRREALAASGTEHPHWVTVYDVGTIEGQPFYSMQLVEGRSLAEIVAEGPLEGREAANYLRPVAQALQTAHENKIVHRDLKPHNLLVEQASNRALIADFGLAKLAETDAGGTCTGEVFGSPSYLSPEQAIDSSRVDERSDIYSLGATLYHLVTGRPPFHSPSIAQTIQQVLDGSPVAPRELVPDIDIDLETICLKCMHQDPAERYASAADLADELHRYLEHRPILARRAGPVRRTWQWARRNPIVATLAASIALLMAVIGVGSVSATLITMDALASSNESLVNERKAKREVTDSLIDYIEVITSDPMMADVRLQPLREELLQDAGAQLDQFLTNVDLEQADRVRIAEVWCMIAQVHLDSGKADEAQRAADRAFEISTRAGDDSLEMKAIELRSRLMLAELDWESGRFLDAIERIDQLVEQWNETWSAAHAQEGIRNNRFDLMPRTVVESLVLAADVHLAMGQLEQAEMNLDRALRLVGEFEWASDMETISAISNVHDRQSRLFARQNDATQALDAANAALESWNEIVDPRGDQKTVDDFESIETTLPPSYYRQRLHLAQLYWRLEDFENAVDCCAETIMDLERIYADQPMTIEVGLVLTKAISFMGQTEYRAGRLQDYALTLEELNGHIESLIEVDDGRRSLRIRIIDVLLSSSHLRHLARDEEECRKLLLQGSQLIAQMHQSGDQDQELKSFKLLFANALAESFLRTKELDVAAKVILPVVLEMESNAGFSNVHVTVAEQYALALARQIRIVRGLGDPDLLEHWHNSQEQLLLELVRQFPYSRILEVRRAQAGIERLFEGAEIATDEMTRSVREHVAILDELADTEVDVRAIETAALQCSQLAFQLASIGDLNASEELARRALSLFERMDFATDGDFSSKKEWADVHYLAGTLRLSHRDPVSAQLSFERSAIIYQEAMSWDLVQGTLDEQVAGSWMSALFFAVSLGPQNADETRDYYVFELSCEIFDKSRTAIGESDLLLSVYAQLLNEFLKHSMQQGDTRDALVAIERSIAIAGDQDDIRRLESLRASCAIRLHAQSLLKDYLSLVNRSRATILAIWTEVSRLSLSNSEFRAGEINVRRSSGI